MARSFYSHIKEAWRSPKEGKLAELQWQRKQEWRDQGAIERIERPTRLDKARELGYKAKQGVVLTRISIRKGTARKSRFTAGRRSKRTGVNRIGRKKNLQHIAEECAELSDVLSDGSVVQIHRTLVLGPHTLNAGMGWCWRL